MRLSPDTEALWPHLRSEGYTIASRETWQYNCVAFAAGVENEWWWPDSYGDAKWPEDVEREERPEHFAKAFGTLGYELCQGEAFEPGYEKIAIYALNGIPTHVSKQLPDGRWKSKLGAWEDIEHNTLKALEEYIYGKPVLYMRRKVKD